MCRLLFILKKGGERDLEPWKNGNDKRVCDISEDHKEIVIVSKGFITRITANPDGTLKLENIAA